MVREERLGSQIEDRRIILGGKDELISKSGRGRRFVFDGHSKEELCSEEISAECQNFPLRLVVSLDAVAEKF